MMYRGDKFEYNKIQSAFTLKAGDFVDVEVLDCTQATLFCRLKG